MLLDLYIPAPPLTAVVVCSNSGIKRIDDRPDGYDDKGFAEERIAMANFVSAPSVPVNVEAFAWECSSFLSRLPDDSTWRSSV